MIVTVNLKLIIDLSRYMVSKFTISPLRLDDDVLDVHSNVRGKHKT